MVSWHSLVAWCPVVKDSIYVMPGRVVHASEKLREWVGSWITKDLFKLCMQCVSGYTCW